VLGSVNRRNGDVSPADARFSTEDQVLWLTQVFRELPRLEHQRSESRNFQIILVWNNLNAEEARSLPITSRIGCVIELSHWFLLSTSVQLKPNLVVFELTVEWTPTVIEELSNLHFEFRTIGSLNTFHVAHGVA
jgi:hypothetical protein